MYIIKESVKENMILQNILKVVYLFQTREMNKKYKKILFRKIFFLKL